MIVAKRRLKSQSRCGGRMHVAISNWKFEHSKIRFFFVFSTRNLCFLRYYYYCYCRWYFADYWLCDFTIARARMHSYLRRVVIAKFLHHVARISMSFYTPCKTAAGGGRTEHMLCAGYTIWCSPVALTTLYPSIYTRMCECVMLLAN